MSDDTPTFLVFSDLDGSLLDHQRPQLSLNRHKTRLMSIAGQSERGYPP